MTDRKKKAVIESDTDEAVARLLQTDPKELTDALKEVERKQGEVHANVESSRDSIQRGARRTKHRFRL